MRAGTEKRVPCCTRVNGLIKSSFYKFLWVSYVVYTISIHAQSIITQRDKKTNPMYLFGLIRMGKNAYSLKMVRFKNRKKHDINDRVN